MRNNLDVGFHFTYMVSHTHPSIVGDHLLLKEKATERYNNEYNLNRDISMLNPIHFVFHNIFLQSSAKRQVGQVT